PPIRRDMHFTASPLGGLSKFSPSSGMGTRTIPAQPAGAVQACFCPPTAACGTRSSLGNTVTLRSSRMPSGCIEQCPSKCAPSWTESTGAVMFPLTFAEGRISIRWVATISPLTLPATETETARIWAVTTAVSPILRVSFAVISPSTSPSILAGPSKEILPEIFDPRSRYARPSDGAGPLARGATAEIGDEVGAAGAGDIDEPCGVVAG